MVNISLISNMNGNYTKTYTGNTMNRKLGKIVKPIIIRDNKTENKRT